MPPAQKIKRLTEFYQALENTVTQEDFSDFTKKLLGILTTIQEQLVQKIDTAISDKLIVIDTEVASAKVEMQAGVAMVQKDVLGAQEVIQKAKIDLEQIIKETRDANTTTLAGLKTRALEAMDGLFTRMRLTDRLDAVLSEYEDKILELDAKIATVPTVEQVLALIPPPKTDIPEEVTNLQAEIKRIYEELKRIEAIRGQRGGGTSAIGVAQAFKYIAHTEQPTGLINGSNTTYTVKSNIWWIAGFTLNGEQIAQLPNFTISGHTITFTSALPADYSGKDFEVKYIGT